MKSDTFDNLPTLADLPSDPIARYSKLEEILSIIQPRLNDKIELVGEGWYPAIKMALEFFGKRQASFGMNKEWPFTVDEHGRAIVCGGRITVYAPTSDLADTYLEEFQKYIAAKMPEHMQNCRDLEALFAKYEPFAKDMVLRYAAIDTLQENRDNHHAYVGISKGPFIISLSFDMKSAERNYCCAHGDPAKFSDEGVRADLKRHNEKHNIYIVDHPSPTISSEELLRCALFLIDEKYNILQQEANVIKAEMEKLGLVSDSGRDNLN